MANLATSRVEPAQEANFEVPPLHIITHAADARFYRPELDVLRFFAFLSVFLYHGLPAFDVARHNGLAARLALYETRIRDAGSFGVGLFFVLSSYLITELLLREQRRTGSVHVSAFYARRILRIWPLYFAFLALGLALSLFIKSYWLEAKAIVAFLFLAGNWYVSGRMAYLSDNPIWPLWSVSVEEQFYLLWPWIAKFGGERWIRRLSLCLIPLSYATLYWLARGGPHSAITARSNSVVQFQFFALGALLALALRGRAPQLNPATRIVMLMAAAASWFGATFVFHVDFVGAIPSPAWWVTGYAFIALGCVLFIGGFLGAPADIFPRPLVYLGKISYGLYVFHLLSLNIVGPLLWPSDRHRALLQTPFGMTLLTLWSFVTLLIALGATIAMAALSYRFLERPFLNLKQRVTFIRSRSV